MKSAYVIACARALYVLEHVRNKNAVSQMAFSLKRGGKILVSISNAFSPAMSIDDVLPEHLSETLIHILGGPHYYERHSRLNPWSLKRRLIENGLRPKKLLIVGDPSIGKPWMYQQSETHA